MWTGARVIGIFVEQTHHSEDDRRQEHETSKEKELNSLQHQTRHSVISWISLHTTGLNTWPRDKWLTSVIISITSAPVFMLLRTLGCTFMCNSSNISWSNAITYDERYYASKEKCISNVENGKNEIIYIFLVQKGAQFNDPSIMLQFTKWQV